MKNTNTKKIVKEHYKKIAYGNKKCCSCKNTNIDISKAIGYSDEDISSFPDANLGLGCGNPTAFSEIQKGDVILDLGSGAGFDCFLAAKKVGTVGRVIGVDMTKEMIKKAQDIAKKYGYKNVEFRLGDIENLPVEDDSVDVIISNCVINLSPDKLKVFKEAKRVLKKNGKMFVSDIVLLEQLTDEQKNDPELVAGCVGGALLKDEYLKIIRQADLNYMIISEDKEISKKQYKGINLESLHIKVFK